MSDLIGSTGLAILGATVAGERDLAVLAKLRDPRIKASEETTRKSLEGNWRAEHILDLKQRPSLSQGYRDQIRDCDREIEGLIAAFEPRLDPVETPYLKTARGTASAPQKKVGIRISSCAPKPTSCLAWTSRRFPG